MIEISTADLRDLHANLSEMHANLTTAGVAQYAAISNDISRLGARINVARAEILDLKLERDALREQANAAHAALEEANTTNLRLAGELAQAQAERASARAEVEAFRARLAERPAPPDPRHPPVESDVEACWALLEEENPEARKWGSLNGALQNTLINLRAELRRAEGQLARAKAKAHTLLDEAIEGEDGA